MRILTNVTKTELDYLTNQPTAKAMIEKIQNEGIFIPKGDTRGATEFAAMKSSQKQETYLHISSEGMARLEMANKTKEANASKENVSKENTSQEDYLKEKIVALRKAFVKLKAKPASSEKAKLAREKKAHALMQQISILSMQLLQLQEANSQASNPTAP